MLCLRVLAVDKRGLTSKSERNLYVFTYLINCVYVQVVRKCNEGARTMERTEMMYTINSQLEFKIKVCTQIVTPKCWSSLYTER